MTENSREIEQNMSHASSAIADASNAISGNITKFKKEISPMLTQDEPRVSDSTVEFSIGTKITEESENVMSQRLRDLMDSADIIFYDALSSRNESPGKGRRQLVVSAGGTNKVSIVDKLYEEERLEEEYFELLWDIYYLDVSTRPTGRKTLEADTLSELEKRSERLITKYLQSRADEIEE